MKKLTSMIMLSSICAFATEGAADQLASGIMGIIGTLVAVIIMFIALMLLYGIFEGICVGINWLWEHSTIIGKVLIFGIPGGSIIATFLYCIIYMLIPWLVENVTPFAVYIILICGTTIYYISTWETGWEWNYNSPSKQNSIYGLVSRIIALIPVTPLIIMYWIIKNLFGKLCIANYECTSLFAIWTVNK